MNAAGLPPVSRGGLLRVLGVGFGLAVIIGNTIGAGILRTPGDVARYLPYPALFLGVWVVGGLYALLGAFSLSELCAMMPRSGGYYVFALRSLGEFAGFTVGWADWLAQCGTTAAVAIVIAGYAGELLPALAGHTVLVAATVTIAVALLQWRGIRTGSMTQNITSLLKTLAFVAVVAAAFLFRHPAAVGVAAPTEIFPHPLWVAVLLALQAVIYTYDGWYGIIYFGEEVRDPARDIRRSMVLGVLALMAIYLLVNIALLHVLPMSAIAGQTMALGTAAAAIFGSRGHTILQMLMILSMLSGINAYHLMASRIPFAMSQDGLLSRQAARVNPGGTPTAGLFLSTVLALMFILGGKTFETVLAMTAFYFVADYAMAYTAVFVLRWREPDAPRPYRAWGYPWTTGLALLGSVAFLVAIVAEDTRNSVYALLSLGMSYPLYRITRVLLRRG